MSIRVPSSVYSAFWMGVSRPSHGLTSRLRTSSSGARLVSALVVCCLLSLPITAARRRSPLTAAWGQVARSVAPATSSAPRSDSFAGTNLFHSFGQFDIQTGESATFTGPSVRSPTC